MSGFFVIGLPIGNLGDISPRAISTLEAADLIFSEDTRTFQKLASLCGFRYRGKLLSLDHHQEQSRALPCLEALRNGQTVALVSEAGTPGISDPGARLVAAVLEAGYQPVSVPGPSILSAALSLGGWEGPVWVLGFAPRKARELVDLLADCPGGTAAFFLESPLRLRATLEALKGREVVLFHELTKVHEGVFRGLTGDLLLQLDPQPKGEWAMLVLPLPLVDRVAEHEAAKDWLAALMPHLGGRLSARIVASQTGLPKNLVYGWAKETVEFAPDPPEA